MLRPPCEPLLTIPNPPNGWYSFAASVVGAEPVGERTEAGDEEVSLRSECNPGA
jgi:hypothetical protein